MLKPIALKAEAETGEQKPGDHDLAVSQLCSSWSVKLRSAVELREDRVSSREHCTMELGILF